VWEKFFEVHRVSVLESQEFSMRQGQKVLTEVSGPLIHVKDSLYLPANSTHLEYP